MELDTSDTGGGWTPHDEGQYTAICVDIIEKYNVETQWGAKNKVGIIFATDAPYREDQPQTVSRWFTASMHPKANLRAFVESWFGKKLPKDSTNFDTEKLIGCKAALQVVHNEAGDTVYANIDTVMKAPTGCKLTIPGDYVRHKDRELEEAAVSKPNFDDPPDALSKDDTSDLPF